MSDERVWTHAGGDVVGAVASIAEEGRPGALVRVEMEAAFGVGEADLRVAWSRALARLGRVPAARRAGERTLYLVAEGDRAALADAALGLFSELRRASPRVWKLVFVEVIPGDASATLMCDPGYDLRRMGGSAALWVRPVPTDTWRPGRYPRSTILASSE